MAGASALVLASVTMWLLRSGESLLVTGAMAVASIIAVLGFIDSMLARVELERDSLVVFHNLKRATYPRTELTEVSWGKGVATAVRRSSGEWVKLPGVGSSGQGLASSIRAWLKRDSA